MSDTATTINASTTREVSVNSNRLWLLDLKRKAELGGTVWDAGCREYHAETTGCGVCTKVIPQFQEAFSSVPEAARSAFSGGLEKISLEVEVPKTGFAFLDWLPPSPSAQDLASLTCTMTDDGTWQFAVGPPKPGPGQLGPIMNSDDKSVNKGVFLLPLTTGPSVSVNTNSLWGADWVNKAKQNASEGHSVWSGRCAEPHYRNGQPCPVCSKVIPQFLEAFSTVRQDDQLAVTQGLANAYTGTFFKTLSNLVLGSLTCTKNIQDGTWNAYFGPPLPGPGQDGPDLDPGNPRNTLKGVFLVHKSDEDPVMASDAAGRDA